MLVTATAEDTSTLLELVVLLVAGLITVLVVIGGISVVDRLSVRGGRFDFPIGGSFDPKSCDVCFSGWLLVTERSVAGVDDIGNCCNILSPKLELSSSSSSTSLSDSLFIVDTLFLSLSSSLAAILVCSLSTELVPVCKAGPLCAAVSTALLWSPMDLSDLLYKIETAQVYC